MKDFKSNDKWVNCGEKLASFLIGVFCPSTKCMHMNATTHHSWVGCTHHTVLNQPVSISQNPMLPRPGSALPLASLSWCLSILSLIAPRQKDLPLFLLLICQGPLDNALKVSQMGVFGVSFFASFHSVSLLS